MNPVETQGHPRERIPVRAGRVLLPALLLVCMAASRAGPVVRLDQGAAWTDTARDSYYSQDQGSRIMPWKWMQALRTAGGAGFTHDALARFGYLPNPNGPSAQLPIGFTLAPAGDGAFVGMTCSACHTRQIEVDGTAYRVDGGPAFADFQAFLAELDGAVGRVLADDTAFDAFAKAVLGSGGDASAKAQLRVNVETWYGPYHELVVRSLPQTSWGPGRLDAVAMIFNRLTGLDIGPPPSYLIADNIRTADAPVRYPFLWNAARQDRTQWPGFAENGNSLLALGRNLGEVYGVFADFRPQKDDSLLGIDYLAYNSANFEGLDAVEDLIWLIGPPQWPWPVDDVLASKGKEVFDRDTANGGCVQCHGIRTGAFRSFDHPTWATPVLDVGTDTRECQLLTRTAKSGVLEGKRVLPTKPRLAAEDAAANILDVAVSGTIAQHALSLRSAAERVRALEEGQVHAHPELQSLTGIVDEGLKKVEQMADPQPTDDGGCRYESRVLQGIWAAAPYLHNGSVATLADLLEPAARRQASFAVGPAYDIEAVGLAAAQPGSGYTLVTSDCGARNSGNSRCGHEYGTTLSAAEKKALLEYLKTL